MNPPPECTETSTTLDNTHPFGIRPLAVILIILFAFLLRLYAALSTSIINPDGTLYILQAKSLLYHQWDQVSECVPGHISPLPLLIVGIYMLIGDWIASARAVSLVFGTLSLIPLYFLLRQFFRRDTASVALLIFAVIPFLATQSADVIRDPLYWFLVLTGLNFFLRQVEDEKYRMGLFLCSFSFLIATWQRIEGMLFVVVSLAFLLLTRQGKKYLRVFCFLLPLLPVIAVIPFEVSILNSSPSTFFRLGLVKELFFRLFERYSEIRAAIEGLADPILDHTLVSFLEKARNLLWLVALGTVVSYVVKAFFYPAFAVFLFGAPDFLKRASNDKRIAYLLVLSIAGLMLVYLYLLYSWFIYRRFMVVFVFPAFIGVGYGLERIIGFLGGRFGLKRSFSLAIIVFIVLSLCLPKSLKPREEDKVLFKEMGNSIARQEGNKEPIHILGIPSPALAWVSFYANLNFPGALCPLRMDSSEITGLDNHKELVEWLRKKGARYFLYEEKRWPQENFLEQVKGRELLCFMQGYHQDTGRILLFQVR